ncbi:replicative DNA helicase [Desulfatibacillum aliphaticivorans]|uniref:Replicative DNA helicase n=1 Tax=Desulfatibacillum aliphaticivorans TaxID=218208 RepID=B8FI53_DESAL|nr:replicative DNA helicase [Desulfatibacillum aliphaticivorans]ACL02620.1 replicative DNA helicase [Desulfatibacillum aliphaticivorans]
MAAKNKDQSLTKLPPHNIEAEESILSAILLDNQALLEVQEILSPGDFYRDAHAKIYSAMLKLFSQSEPVDLVTIANKLQEQKEMEAVGGAAFLSRLVNSVPMAANSVYYANIVRDKSLLRRLISSASDIATKAYEDKGNVREVVDFAESSIFAVAEEKGGTSMSQLGGLINSALESIAKRAENRALITGVDTGFSRLNTFTAGFQPSDLIILAARPGMGKTAFALNIARNAAVIGGAPTLVFSLEMSSDQLCRRLLCAEARVNSANLRSGFFAQDDHSKLVSAAHQLYEAPIFIDDSPVLTAMDVRAKARRLKKDKGLGFVVIDYVQLMKGPPEAERRDLEISEISRSLKALAKELEIPVLALSQLNRKVEERSDKRPQIADLRESGALEQDADMIMFIYREAAYSQEEGGSNSGEAEIKIAKQRSGPTGKFTLYFNADYTRFDNLSADAGAPAQNGQ